MSFISSAPIILNLFFVHCMYLLCRQWWFWIWFVNRWCTNNSILIWVPTLSNDIDWFWISICKPCSVLIIRSFFCKPTLYLCWLLIPSYSVQITLILICEWAYQVLWLWWFLIWSVTLFCANDSKLFLVNKPFSVTVLILNLEALFLAAALTWSDCHLPCSVTVVILNMICETYSVPLIS